MQRYDDPVEVRRTAPDEQPDRPDRPDRPGGAGGTPGLPPSQLLWRGRLWKVRQVLAHRVEPATSLVPAGGPAPAAARELWRVRAGRGGLETDAVLDLTFDPGAGSWRLVGRRPERGHR